MHRNADRAGLIRDGSRDRLPDPPRRVGRELESALIVELVDGLHQADVAFLNQIQELQPAIGVALRDRDHQPKVRLDQLLLRDFSFLLAALHHLKRAPQLARRCAGLLFVVLHAMAVLLEFLAQVRDHDRRAAGAPSISRCTRAISRSIGRMSSTARRSRPPSVCRISKRMRCRESAGRS